MSPTLLPPAEEVAREIGASCLGFRTRLLDRVVARVFDEELRAVDLRNTQLTLLVAVHRLGPVSPAKMVDWLELEKSTLSRNLSRLEQRGLIEEKPGPDGRTHLVSITEAGDRMLLAAYPAWQQAQARVLEMIGDEAGEEIRRMVRRIWRQD